jgi:hypothetical protein
VGLAGATRLCAALSRLLSSVADPQWFQFLSGILGHYGSSAGCGSGTRVLVTKKMKKKLYRVPAERKYFF